MKDNLALLTYWFHQMYSDANFEEFETNNSCDVRNNGHNQRNTRQRVANNSINVS